MGKHAKIHLPTEHHRHLRDITRKGNKHDARTITRARILLLADRSQGEIRTRQEIATLTQTGVTTVTRITNRYATDGLNAALEEQPRPGAKPKITGDIEAKITQLACSEPPEGAARWTLSLLKDRIVAEGWLASVGRSTLGDRLKKTRSNPGR